MPEQVFRSTAHPGQQSLVLLHTRRLVRPLALANLPVMIGTLVGMLQGVPVLAFFVVGIGFALLGSSLWTHFWLRKDTAEVRVRDGAAAVRSIWEVASGAPVRWEPVLDLRDTLGERTVTVGLASYDFDKREWPQMDAMTQALKHAQVGRHWWTQQTPDGTVGAPCGIRS